MRPILSLFLLPALLLTVKDAPVIEDFTIAISSSHIGPYGEYDNDSNITFTVYNQMNLERTFDFRYQFFVNEILKGGYTNLNRVLAKKGSTMTFTITPPFDFIKENTKVTYKVIVEEDGNENNVIKGDFNYSKKPNIYLNVLSSPYLLKDGSYKFNKDEKIEYTYPLSFSDFNEPLLEIDKGKVDFKNIKLSYLGNISYQSAYFILDDSFFIDFPSKYKIPLNLVINNKEISFEIGQTLYVNPKTYEMSLEMKEGYLETRNLFIPKNKTEELSKKDIKFYIDGFGETLASVSFSSHFDYERKTIGDCAHSDICIVGGLG